MADARISSQNVGGGTLRDRLEDLGVRLREVVEVVVRSDEQIRAAKDQGAVAQQDVEQAKSVIERARETLKVSFKKGSLASSTAVNFGDFNRRRKSSWRFRAARP